MTSAFLALRLYLGDFKHVVVPFDQIFDAVKTGRADAGLIIHEGQLTYERVGLSEDRRPWRMVETPHRLALAAWWKCYAQGHSARYPARFARRSCAKASILV